MIRLYARPLPPLSSANCLAFSVFLCAASPGYWRERGGRGWAWSRIIGPQENLASINRPILSGYAVPSAANMAVFLWEASVRIYEVSQGTVVLTMHVKTGISSYSIQTVKTDNGLDLERHYSYKRHPHLWFSNFRWIPTCWEYLDIIRRESYRKPAPGFFSHVRKGHQSYVCVKVC